MSRHRKPAPAPAVNPSWEGKAAPRSGWITVDGRRVYVTEVDACTLAPFLPEPPGHCPPPKPPEPRR